MGGGGGTFKRVHWNGEVKKYRIELKKAQKVRRNSTSK